MQDLRKLCEKVGFEDVRTYIQSGNIIFKSTGTESDVINKLEAGLEKKQGRRIAVMVRSLSELEKIAANNPFPEANPSQVGLMFFASPVSKNFIGGVSTTTGEILQVRKREVYIHYVNGMGRSKLKLPKEASEGTVRNMNTINKVIGIANSE
jgi:uncharacterized protein (DUF1697 family)